VVAPTGESTQRGSDGKTGAARAGGEAGTASRRRHTNYSVGGLNSPHAKLRPTGAHRIRRVRDGNGPFLPPTQFFSFPTSVQGRTSFLEKETVSSLSSITNRHIAKIDEVSNVIKRGRNYHQ
jgi:hypothetical protein